MYIGDGSYKQTQKEYKTETSLQDLMNKEKELVDNYNNAIKTYDIALKNSMRSTEYIKDIKLAQEKLCETRQQIKNYLVENLNVKLDIINELYE